MAFTQEKDSEPNSEWHSHSSGHSHDSEPNYEYRSDGVMIQKYIKRDAFGAKKDDMTPNLPTRRFPVSEANYERNSEGRRSVRRTE